MIYLCVGKAIKNNKQMLRSRTLDYPPSSSCRHIGSHVDKIRLLKAFHRQKWRRTSSWSTHGHHDPCSAQFEFMVWQFQSLINNQTNRHSFKKPRKQKFRKLDYNCYGLKNQRPPLALNSNEVIKVISFIRFGGS